ncbi:sensor histidine kinase [Marinoscillum furvescens]|uniref:histidine kinase n=1 Tax=Marinoscillum furvescens DSM 4134 TaxID=1122208 RepID=A0A3D9KZ29_MARFU|nr:PAS domain-containing sensor histidine kinase [Marinoscillum furvescens]RED91903.1 PAS domain S-box-containing protein [Marinoscillum furvescens DSM 4134]
MMRRKMYWYLFGKFPRGLSKIEQKHVSIVNKINLLSLSLALVLFVVNLLIGWKEQAIASMLSVLLVFGPVVFINRSRYHAYAKVLMSLGVTVIIAAVSVINLHAGRLINVEIILFGVGIFIMLIESRSSRVVLYLLVVAAVFGIESYKQYYLGLPFDSLYVFSLINYSVAFICIYFFSQIFRGELSGFVSEVNLLNRKLEKGRAALEQSKMMLDSMINNSPLMLVMLDAQRRFVEVNRKFLEAFDLEKEHTVGRKFEEVMPEEVARFHAPLLDRSAQGSPIDFYQEVELPSGIYTHAYGKYFPVNGATGEVEYITAFFTDITELKKVEKKLKELNRTKDRLFSIIAHDISSPINLLRNALDLSDHNEVSQEELREQIERIRENLSKLSHMLENLLRWSQAQFHGVESQEQIVSLNRLVKEGLELFKEVADGKSIQVEARFEREYFVLSDKNHLRIMLRNLITNAFKFTPRNGKVRLGADEVSEGIRFYIKDTGVGMSADKMQRLKSNDLLLSEYGTDGEQGTGLGLSLCWELANRNGWEFNVESELGEGSLFSFIIPQAS